MALTFKFEQTGDRQLGAIQRVGQTITQAWNGNAMLSGVDITGELDANGNMTDGIIISAAGLKIVQHKLGRKFRGWVVVRPRGPYVTNVREVTQAANLDDKQITFYADNACIFDLRVW